MAKILDRNARAKIVLSRFLYRIEYVKTRDESRILRWLKRGGGKADAGEYQKALFYLEKCIEIGGDVCIVVVAEIYRDACHAALTNPDPTEAYWLFQDSLWESLVTDRIPQDCRL